MSFHAMQQPKGGAARGNIRISAGMGALSAALLLGAIGCTARITKEPAIVTYEAPAARVEVVPYAIHTYPRVYYGGIYVYLVDGRWYFPTARGWMVYRTEPRELSRYRRQIERSPEVRPRPEYSAPREYRRERRPQ